MVELGRLFQIDWGKTASEARILSPKQMRRPLPCLLIESFFYAVLYTQCTSLQQKLVWFPTPFKILWWKTLFANVSVWQRWALAANVARSWQYYTFVSLACCYRTFVLYLRCGNSVLTQKVLFYFIFPYLRSPIKHCDVVVLWRCRCRDAKQLSRAQLVCLKNHRFTVITRYI